MAKAELVPKLDSSFMGNVATLAKEGLALSKAYADVTERILDFAERVHSLWNQSLELDKGDEQGVHRQHLRDQLAKAVKSDNKSIRSRWIAIGQHATELAEIKSSLPPVRDSLYEVALAIEAKKPVTKWAENGDLTPQSSVREIRALRDRTKTKRSAPKKKKRLAPKTFPAAITLCFETYDDAVRILKPLLTSSEGFKILADKTFANALKPLPEAVRVKANDKLA